MLVVSCSNNGNKSFVPTFKADFEGGGDWINSYTIGKFGGVTGEYCSKVDSVNQNSYGLSKLVSEISSYPILRVKINLSVKLASLSKKALLVISLTDKNNKCLYWSGTEVNPVVKEANKWYNFESEQKFPDFDSSGSNIRIYLWNPNNNEAYIDDFKIQFFEE